MVLGRVFLAPQNETPQGQTVVYVNFGDNSVGEQSFPIYRDAIFGQYFSEAQYNRVASRIKEYLDRNGINECRHCAFMLMAVMTLGICSCPFCYVYYRMQEIDNQLQEIIQEECSQWECDVKLVWRTECNRVASSPRR